MDDIIYKASIAGPRRTYANLLFGFDLGRQTEINYHFYNLAENPIALSRAVSAAGKIRNSGLWIHEHQFDETTNIDVDDIESGEIDEFTSNLILGFVKPKGLKKVIESGNSRKFVNEAIHSGSLSGSVPQLLQEEVLPFRQSPLSGKTLKKIAKDPTVIAVFTVISTKSAAPIAIVVLPVGIVAMHVAMRTGPTIAKWLDKKLRHWLK